ncbi:MAG: DegT/DnrJ/EryC1/StrS family aminotransferase [Steroidobacteraceae bacterium]
MDFIDLKTQYRRIKSSVDARIARVLEHGQYVMGPEVTELEQVLAAYCGTKHCVAVASGTDALLIALLALDVKPGDEVITSPFTFFATAEMIALIGARPVFVDIEPRTWNLDPAKLEAAITPRTKAIMPVSLYGQCADFDAINAIACRHGLPVIEDAAQSFGATYKGRRSNALSFVGATSFFPSKPLGCYGDGGALFTDDDAVAKLMREIRVHGQDRRYHHPRLGLTGRLDSIQAAVLLAKMEIFDDEVAARVRVGAAYARLIEATFGAAGVVRAPHVEPHNVSVYAQYTIEVDRREVVETRMKAAGVPTAVHYPIALHEQPVFEGLGHRLGDFPVSEAAARRVISLPMHPYLTEEQQAVVVAALKEAVEG